jgi:aldose 1-epimerase
MNITKQSFGKIKDGREAFLFTMTNGDLIAKITNFGGIVTSLIVPDRQGNAVDIVLGFNKLDDYLKEHPFFGVLVGRYANRIAKGRFILNGREYTLAVNNGKNHLHGGIVGFDKVLWSAEEIKTADAVGVRLLYTSVDGEEGYPGTVNCMVEYTLTASRALSIRYEARTDKTTVVNLTHHSYFNLAGEGSGDVLGHELTIFADRYTVPDEGSIPTGEIAPVHGTPFDFTTPHLIGERIDRVKGGYDHNYVLNRKAGELSIAARARDPKSGRTMEVRTDVPGMQFYSGNFIDGTLTGKSGAVYGRRGGLCLETQHFPDSPNRPEFPTTTLNPGEVYSHRCIYSFPE